MKTLLIIVAAVIAAIVISMRVVLGFYTVGEGLLLAAGTAIVGTIFAISGFGGDGGSGDGDGDGWFGGDGGE